MLPATCLQAQYNAPTPDLGGLGIPAYRVRVGCNYLADANISTTKLLSGMGAALGVFNGIQGQCLQLGGSGGGFDKFGYQVLTFCNVKRFGHPLLTKLHMRLLDRHGPAGCHVSAEQQHGEPPFQSFQDCKKSTTGNATARVTHEVWIVHAFANQHHSA